MRVVKLIHEHPGNLDFHEALRHHEQWLLGLGERRLSSPKGNANLIEIPHHMAKTCREDVIDAFFVSLASTIGDKEYFKSRTIMAAFNAIVNETNIEMVNCIPGQLHLFLSVDSVSEDDKNAAFPVEFLNTLEPSGIAEHKLHLNVGAQVILLRSINLKATHCNGARYIIQA